MYEIDIYEEIGRSIGSNIKKSKYPNLYLCLFVSITVISPIILFYIF
jgi:hypothetical protein